MNAPAEAEGQHVQRHAIEARAEDLLTRKPLWLVFVNWMRIYGNIDAVALTEAIRDRFVRRLSDPINFADSSTDDCSDLEIFKLMIVRLALFQAAVVDEPAQSELSAVGNQIKRQFPYLWQRMTNGMDEASVLALKHKTRELCAEGSEFRRRPDVEIEAFQPYMVSTATFVEDIGEGLQSPHHGLGTMGPPLYKTTLRKSRRALVGGASLRRVLTAAAAELKAHPNLNAVRHSADEKDGRP